MPYFLGNPSQISENKSGDIYWHIVGDKPPPPMPHPRRPWATRRILLLRLRFLFSLSQEMYTQFVSPFRVFPRDDELVRGCFI